LDAAESRLLAELHDRRATEKDAGLATTRWLARDARVPARVAKQRLSTALTLDRFLPAVADAFTEARIGFDHAQVFANVVNVRNADAFAVLAPQYLDTAANTDFYRWRADVRAAAELLDPDGTHDPASDLTRNRLHLSPTDGLLLLRGELVGDHALIAREAIEAKTDELFRQYSREREQFPDATIPPRATLGAMALVELLRQAQGIDADSSTGPRTDASIVIHADHAPEDPANPPETALAAAGQGTGPVVTTRDGQRLSKSTSAVLVCAALFQVLITSVTGTGVPIAETDGYQPNRAMRRQLRHRDGGCTFPGCGAKPDWCDAHHLEHWPAGPTALHNLTLLCRRHHRAVHRHGWTVTLGTDGWTTWTSPGGTTRPGQRHSRVRAGP
jgi:hypothetical protein